MKNPSKEITKPANIPDPKLPSLFSVAQDRNMTKIPIARIINPVNAQAQGGPTSIPVALLVMSSSASLKYCGFEVFS